MIILQRDLAPDFMGGSFLNCCPPFFAFHRPFITRPDLRILGRGYKALLGILNRPWVMARSIYFLRRHRFLLSAIFDR